jgi:hypothetical protein
MHSLSPGKSRFRSKDSSIAISPLMLRSRQLPPLMLWLQWSPPPLPLPPLFSFILHHSLSSVVIFGISGFLLVVVPFLANSVHKSLQLDTNNLSLRNSTTQAIISSNLRVPLVRYFSPPFLQRSKTIHWSVNGPGGKGWTDDSNLLCQMLACGGGGL